MLYPTRPSASPPITTAKVGFTRLSKPLADWNAVTTRLRSTVAKSANGARIGIVTVANPDEEGIKKFRTEIVIHDMIMLNKRGETEEMEGESDESAKKEEEVI